MRSRCPRIPGGRPALVLALCVALALGLSSPAAAEPPVAGSGAWYYRIGGARPLSPAANAHTLSLGVDLTSVIRLPQACSSLDPALSMAGVLDQIRSGVDQAEQLMVVAANNAIAALPAIVLQRANPGLYEHFQNALAQARALVDLSVKNCRDLVDAAERGEDPFRDWIRVSRRFSMGEAIRGGGLGPVEAERAVDAANGDDGVPWLGGNRGGAGQDPIRIIADTVQAGYNLLLGRGLTDTGPPAPPAGATPRLVELWPAPADAIAWARRVVGEAVVRTCEGCPPADMTPGAGVLPEFERHHAATEATLAALVSGTATPTVAALADVSAPGIMVTPQLLAAVQGVPEDQDRGLITGRLAADIAAARAVEEALTLRRLLLTGRRVPEIAGSAPAAAGLADAVAELEREIETLLYEHDVRRRMLSGTAETVLEDHLRRRQQGLGIPPAPATPGPRLIRGVPE
ncbi:MAG: integrating conjugative element protein [Rhodospirillales bacterium]|nr:MAG: integrating conjugative element protein [Rhodospirillales bacterium]